MRGHCGEHSGTEEEGEAMKATEIGSQTLVGYTGDYPRKRGNCFSILAEDGNSYRIVNFGVENLRELLRQGMVTMPVEIQPIDGRPYGKEALAVIQDGRIGAEWYKEEYCKTCYGEAKK